MPCVDKNIPVIGKTEDGNASDKAVNNAVPTSISTHLSKYGMAVGVYIHIADSALVTMANLKQMEDSILFVSRLPATCKECGKVIKEAVEKQKWRDIGALAATKPNCNRPAAHCRSYESAVTLHGKKYRAVVVHSSAHDRRRRKRIDRELEVDRKAVATELRDLSKKEFYCLKDAEKAMDDLLRKDRKYHELETTVVEIPKYKKGRPKNGLKKIDRTLCAVKGKIEEKRRAVEELRQAAGCFVPLSNVPKEGEMARTGPELLKACKDRHGIERNFSFLKDPAIVNGIFLKKPERMEVLGLVLLISLLVWRLLERAMRNFIEKTGKDLPGWKNRRTTRPTSFMLGTKFAGVIVLRMGEVRRLNKPLTRQQKEYLHALGVRTDVFTNPRNE